MPRRSIGTGRQRAALFDLPTDEAADAVALIIRVYLPSLAPKSMQVMPSERRKMPVNPPILAASTSSLRAYRCPIGPGARRNSLHLKRFLLFMPILGTRCRRPRYGRCRSAPAAVHSAAAAAAEAPAGGCAPQPLRPACRCAPRPVDAVRCAARVPPARRSRVQVLQHRPCGAEGPFPLGRVPGRPGEPRRKLAVGCVGLQCSRRPGRARRDFGPRVRDAVQATAISPLAEDAFGRAAEALRILRPKAAGGRDVRHAHTHRRQLRELSALFLARPRARQQAVDLRLRFRCLVLALDQPVDQAARIRVQPWGPPPAAASARRPRRGPRSGRAAPRSPPSRSPACRQGRPRGARRARRHVPEGRGPRRWRRAVPAAPARAGSSPRGAQGPTWRNTRPARNSGPSHPPRRCSPLSPP